jgi:hypothetical protein
MQNSTSSVYVASSGGGPVKVGYARNVRARLSTLRKQSRRDLSFAFIGTLGRAEAPVIEAKTHQLLHQHRIRRSEWFDITPEAAVAAVKRAANELGFKLVPMIMQPLGRGGRPATGHDPILALRMPPAITKRVEAYAKTEPDQPNRSEALRRLVEWALKEKEKRRG